MAAGVVSSMPGHLPVGGRDVWGKQAWDWTPFSFLLLGMEPRVSHMLGKYSASEFHPWPWAPFRDWSGPAGSLKSRDISECGLTTLGSTHVSLVGAARNPTLLVALLLPRGAYFFPVTTCLHPTHPH